MFLLHHELHCFWANFIPSQHLLSGLHLLYSEINPLKDSFYNKLSISFDSSILYFVSKKGLSRKASGRQTLYYKYLNPVPSKEDYVDSMLFFPIHVSQLLKYTNISLISSFLAFPLTVFLFYPTYMSIKEISKQ